MQEDHRQAKIQKQHKEMYEEMKCSNCGHKLQPLDTSSSIIARTPAGASEPPLIPEPPDSQPTCLPPSTSSSIIAPTPAGASGPPNSQPTCPPLGNPRDLVAPTSEAREFPLTREHSNSQLASWPATQREHEHQS